MVRLPVILTTGPFWISSTTIIILFFSSTLAGYLAALHTDSKYYYDFTLLTAAAGLMYGYAGVIPTILWGAMKWYGCEPSLLEILCLYGYGGMIVWIPVVSPLANLTVVVVGRGDSDLFNLDGY
jgi:hypothetical protein